MPQDLHLPEQLAQIVDERANFCFGCGVDNPQSLKLTFVIDSADPANITATATANLTKLHEGAPGYLHGGIIATLMDEAMSKVNKPLGVLAMTRTMEVNYLRPCPINMALMLVGRHLRRDGRKLYHAAELVHPNGTVLARAKGFFVIIDPALISRGE